MKIPCLLLVLSFITVQISALRGHLKNEEFININPSITHRLENSNLRVTTTSYNETNNQQAPFLFEGDIVPTTSYIMEVYGLNLEKKLEKEGILNIDIENEDHKVALSKADKPLHGTQVFNLWNTRVDDIVQIPYSFRIGDFSFGQIQDIESYINSLAKRSGVVEFIPRTNQNSYIQVQSESSGCWSYVGKIEGIQPLNLYSPCVQIGVTQHEFLHALGFSHEQSRTDRDNYVKINVENIRTGMANNFAKQTNGNSLGSPYDYGSVMHYGAWDFSSNGKKTIETPNGEDIGQRQKADDLDINQLRLMYQCSTGPRTLSEFEANMCTENCPCWEGALGCKQNNKACQGDLLCVQNTCVGVIPTSKPTSNSETCYSLTFKTGDGEHSTSEGPFTIEGYGQVPEKCHSFQGAECSIEICTKTNVMEITANTVDAWEFTISGDVLELLKYKTIPGGTHIKPFPTWLDTDQTDYYQKYSLKKEVKEPEVTERIFQQRKSSICIPSKKTVVQKFLNKTIHQCRNKCKNTSNCHGYRYIGNSLQKCVLYLNTPVQRKYVKPSNPKLFCGLEVKA